MGRLFWKFFLAFFLAQMTAMVGIGAVFWIEHQAQDHQGVARNHPAETTVHAAAATLETAGPAAFQRFVQTMPGGPPLKVFACDENGHDLAGRLVPAGLFHQARQLAERSPASPAVRTVVMDGQRYWLFAQRDDGPNPGGPPGAEPGPGLGGPADPPPPHGSPFLHVEPLVAGLVASLLFSVLLAWHFSKPIRVLREAFASVSHGDLNVQPTAQMHRRHDELRDLAHDFEHMAGRIKQLMDGQRRLLHDVSHELRSPLARLQLAIDLMQQQPHKTADSMRRIEREAARMDKLVGEVLTLSRLEAGVDAGRREAFDLAELVADLVADARFEAEAQQQKVECAMSGLLLVDGNYMLLHSALENIVRNALRYSPPGCTVRIEAAPAEGGWLRVAVLDQGPGVALHELAGIFEAFHRGEGRQGADGHGLGLAIAKRVVESHGGTIAAFNLPEGGLCMEIRLPVVL